VEKLTWMSADGKHQLAAWIEIGFGGANWCAELDGHIEGRVYAPSTNIPVEARKAGIVAAIGRVALSVERYKALLAEAARLEAEYAKSPAALKTKRERLCNALRGSLEDARDAREAAFEADCVHGLPGYDTPAVSEAQQALAAFDAAHPEIVAAIEAEKEAAAARNRWR